MDVIVKVFAKGKENEGKDFPFIGGCYADFYDAIVDWAYVPVSNDHPLSLLENAFFLAAGKKRPEPYMPILKPVDIVIKLTIIGHEEHACYVEFCGETYVDLCRAIQRELHNTSFDLENEFVLVKAESQLLNLYNYIIELVKTEINSKKQKTTNKK